jgi:hypothetical protein
LGVLGQATIIRRKRHAVFREEDSFHAAATKLIGPLAPE